MDEVTIAIKHSGEYESRRVKLRALLSSIRVHHGAAVAVLVASEGSWSQDDEFGVRHLQLWGSGGLSAGRNALVRAVRTEFMALMDDDLLLRDNTSIPMLLAALRRAPGAALAGGCYLDVATGARLCYNMNFDPSDDGSIVQLRRARQPAGGGCGAAHMTHNFFVARAEALRRFPWDERQEVMEHESFFYQLYANGQQVIACADAAVGHNTKRDDTDPYEKRSKRAMKLASDPGQTYTQYLCKNMPEVLRFITPYYWWHCDAREVCSPHYDAEFQADGRACVPMPWTHPEDDASAIRRLLLLPHHDDRLFPVVAQPTALRRRQRRLVPLLVLILTQPHNAAGRSKQRNTWLSFRWHASVRREGGGVVPADDDELVPWRHVFVSRHAPEENRSDAGVIYGDTASVPVQFGEGGAAARSAHRIAAIEWALSLSDVTFGTLLLTDDESVVHVGRVWRWLVHNESPARLYAGAPLAARGASSAQRPLEEYGLLLGRSACRRMLRVFETRRGSGGPVGSIDSAARAARLDATSAPGFRKLSRGDNKRELTQETFADMLLVHGVQRQHYQGTRWLMTSRTSIAAWQNPKAFVRADCPGCEARFFRAD